MGQHVDNSSIVSFGILTKVNGGNDDRFFRKKIVCMLPTTHTPPPSPFDLPSAASACPTVACVRAGRVRPHENGNGI